MFGFSPLASTAFNSLRNLVASVTPVTWGQKGGIKKHEEIKKSRRAEIQESIAEIFAEPTAKEIVEEVKEYVKPSQAFTPFSIDYKKLSQDISAVQRIMAKAQELRDEQEDEATLLLLL